MQDNEIIEEKHTLDESSSRVTFGGRSQGISEPILPHDFVELNPKTKARINEICSPLYEKGLSLRDIEERTGIPKTTIRETLNRSEFALRNFVGGNQNSGDRKRSKRCGHTPYGFAYLDGQLVIDPKEHLVIRRIMKLHHSGKWQKSVIHSIIKRHKKNK